MSEIADRLGVARITAKVWNDRRNRVLPEPQWTVSGSPAWCWPHVVEPWARRTGRLR